VRVQSVLLCKMCQYAREVCNTRDKAASKRGKCTCDVCCLDSRHTTRVTVSQQCGALLRRPGCMLPCLLATRHAPLTHFEYEAWLCLDPVPTEQGRAATCKHRLLPALVPSHVGIRAVVTSATKDFWLPFSLFNRDKVHVPLRQPGQSSTTFRVL
jgi:hypothetical protein